VLLWLWWLTIQPDLYVIGEIHSCFAAAVLGIIQAPPENSRLKWVSNPLSPGVWSHNLYLNSARNHEATDTRNRYHYIVCTLSLCTDTYNTKRNLHFTLWPNDNRHSFKAVLIKSVFCLVLKCVYAVERPKGFINHII
jgi:hypothetical protein